MHEEKVREVYRKINAGLKVSPKEIENEFEMKQDREMGSLRSRLLRYYPKKPEIDEIEGLEEMIRIREK